MSTYPKRTNALMLVAIVAVIGTLTIGLIMWGVPQYRLYSQNLTGQANLRQQEWEKRIAIEEARAARESAELYAEAEVARARGVAEANAIIADGLSGQQEYLRYLWINQLTNNPNQVIYVPTEAGIPILEAGQR